MPAVQTARGPVDTAALGFTLMHEHVITAGPNLFANWPHLFDRAAEVVRAGELLEEARAAGVQTLVDLTTVDLGRDVALVREIAHRTELHIIVATGVHLNPPGYFRRRRPEPIVDLYVRDIEQGCAHTGVRAGILKIANEQDVTAEDELQLRAIALAHRATGVPISTHSNPARRNGLDQQRVFRAEGVDLSRVVIGHSGDTTDLGYLSALMEAGSTIGLDRFGLDVGTNTEQRIGTIVELCRRGFADRLVLSHDTAAYADVFPLSVHHHRPDWNFLTIPTKVIPEVCRRGVAEEQIAAMTVGNPRRLFERQGPY